MLMLKNSVSIVVVCGDDAKVLTKTLSLWLLVAIRYSAGAEIVFVDNASHDGTEGLLESFLQEHESEGLKMVHVRNSHKKNIRNSLLTALPYVSGDYTMVAFGSWYPTCSVLADSGAYLGSLNLFQGRSVAVKEPYDNSFNREPYFFSSPRYDALEAQSDAWKFFRFDGSFIPTEYFFEPGLPYGFSGKRELASAFAAAVMGRQKQSSIFPVPASQIAIVGDVDNSEFDEETLARMRAVLASAGRRAATEAKARLDAEPEPELEPEVEAEEPDGGAE